ncbi:MAG TPA: DUF4388 domain-containing protein [Acidimicrobiales bacterium]|nr:DUF4388 domain-containing protein [Acidimicrobiales bacterium]
MALQGTLDTFALIDVFRLLASTNKTGRLLVTGDRGNGSVWFDGGGVVLAAAHNTKPSDAPVTVIFELLRQHEGTFVFEAEVTTPEAGAPSDVENLIREAEHLLIEWQEIEAVVPSVTCWVSMSPELPRPEVVVDGERWKVIVATGAGSTVAGVGDILGLGEIAVSKAVKQVVEIGLLTISVAPAGAMPARVAEPAPAIEPEPVFSEPEPEPISEPEPAHEPVIDLVPEPEPAHEPEAAAEPEPDPASELVPQPEPAAASGAMGIDIPGFSTLAPSVQIEKEPEPVAPVSTKAQNGTWAARLQDAAQQESNPEPQDDPMLELPNLTPQAARAIAAAAQASTEAERDAALAMATGPNDEPLDRDLLLRFLSSVKR